MIYRRISAPGRHTGVCPCSPVYDLTFVQSSIEFRLCVASQTQCADVAILEIQTRYRLTAITDIHTDLYESNFPKPPSVDWRKGHVRNARSTRRTAKRAARRVQFP